MKMRDPWILKTHRRPDVPGWLLSDPHAEFPPNLAIASISYIAELGGIVLRKQLRERK